MHFVGAPQITVADPAKRAESPRNPLYQIRTSDEGDTMKAPSASSSDPMTYAPGELVTLHLRVTNRFTESRRAKDGIGGMFACWPGLGMLFHGFTQMCSFTYGCCAASDAPANFLDEPKGRGKCYSKKSWCMKPHPWAAQPIGREIQAWETSKYMGLLMYAEDETGNKVGEWEIIPESPPRFWTPPDPGCNGKALMHADVRLKRFHHIFHWRAPATPQGLGKKITFRVLIKHGYTNGGAFFWPLAPAMPGGMQSKYDLALTEIAPRGAGAGWFVSKIDGASCDTVCAANSDGAVKRTCDEALLRSEGSNPLKLEAAIRSTLACKLPILSSCDGAAPAVASSGGGGCWYHDDFSGRCPLATAPAKCNSAAPDSMRRLCPCTADPAGRRRLDETDAMPARAASAAGARVANGAAPRGVASHGALGISALLLASSGSSYRSTALALGAMWGFATLIPTAHAHNWLQKPSSRADHASTTPLCPAKIGSAPNVQLNPGESFPFEWRVAHPGSRVMFTLIRAKDEAMLSMASRSALDDYLAGAPSTAARAKNGITCGSHRAAACSACKTGKCGGECVLVAGQCVEDPANAYRLENAAYPEGRYMDDDMFEKRFISTGSGCSRPQGDSDGEGGWRGVKLERSDARNIYRPAPYNCQDGYKIPTAAGGSKGHNCQECSSLRQWVYHDKHVTVDDRAGYNSSKYPWIVSVSAYKIASPGPHDVGCDIAKLTVPASLGAGNYILQYSWGGYQDCVDIAVLPPKVDGTPAIAAAAGTPEGDYSRHSWINVSISQFQRIDHCQFVRRTLGSTGHGQTKSSSEAYWKSKYEALPLNDAGLVATCEKGAGIGWWPPASRTWGHTRATCMALCVSKNMKNYAMRANGDCMCFWGWEGVHSSSKYLMAGAADCSSAGKIEMQAACIAIPPPGNRSSLNFTDAEALQLCQQRGKRVSANGLNVVPLDPPPGVRLSIYDPSKAGVYYNSDTASTNVATGLNIPWGVGNCQRKYFANEPAGTRICYPLQIYGMRANAELEWQIELDDVEDEVWYSTCYKKAPVRNFDVPCGAQCKPAVVKEWRFSDRCTSCEDTSRNADPTVVPNWQLAHEGSCSPCFKPVSDAPTFQLPPADTPENGWMSPDGGMSMTWTRTQGTTDSVTFVVVCAACTGDGGYLAIGPSPSNGMIDTHAVRWVFTTGAVDEIKISKDAKTLSNGFITVTRSHLAGVKTTSEPADAKKAKTLTFTSAQIGDHTFPGRGDQKWAWAYRTSGATFTQHGGTVNNRGVAEFSFTLDPPPVPAPTAPPVYDPAVEIVDNSNDGKPDPTFAPTLAPSLLPPDANRPRIEATVTLSGCAVESFADGTVIRKSFISILAAKMSLEEKDVIVIGTKAAGAHATPAHRRLSEAASEVGMSTSVEFAVLGYSTQTPTELLGAVALFLNDRTVAGFEFLLQDELLGTKYQRIGVVVDSQPAIAMSAQAISGGAGSASDADAGVAAALISLSVIAVVCLTIVSALTGVVVVVIVKRKRRSNNARLSTSITKAATDAEEAGEHTGGLFDLALLSDDADGTEAFDVKPVREINMQNPYNRKSAVSHSVDDAIVFVSATSTASAVEELSGERQESNASAGRSVAGANPMFTDAARTAAAPKTMGATKAAPNSEPLFILKSSEQQRCVHVLDVAPHPVAVVGRSIEATAADEISAASVVATQSGRAAGFAAALEGFADADSDASIDLGGSEEPAAAKEEEEETEEESSIDIGLDSDSGSESFGSMDIAL